MDYFKWFTDFDISSKKIQGYEGRGGYRDDSRGGGGYEDRGRY